MTPGINSVKQSGIDYTLHQYDHDPAAESYGTEAAEKLGIDGRRVFKTLVADTGQKTLVVAVIPVSATLSMKQLARAVGSKKAAMAAPSDVERSTGYVLGGVSPLGQKKRLPTFLDASASDFPTIFISAGRRGLEIELKPADLLTLCSARLYALTSLP